MTSGRQIIFSLGSAAFTMLERLLILYVPFFFLPPREYQVPNLVPQEAFWGVATVLGIAFLAGRILDAVADPWVAALSDRNRSRVGRRKIFLLFSAFPLTATTVFTFLPPDPGDQSLINGIWLGIMLGLFYIFFTAYVNPYLALIPELGQTNEQRINMSTFIALFGLLGLVVVTIGFPELVEQWQLLGIGFRDSFRLAVLVFSILALILLYVATFSFQEPRNSFHASSPGLGTWDSLKKTYAVRPFRLFIMGEVFLQYSVNIITLGLMYYAVVLFQGGQRFMSLLAALALGTALLSFPFVNAAAKRKGKKRVILSGALLLTLCSTLLFLLSFNLTGAYYYLGLTVFALAGIPLAIFSILVNPTISDLARAAVVQEGERREAMFFGARAVPLKLTIALAGVTFSFLLAHFGKDIENPLGVQLSILTVALASLCGYIIFSFYPEEEVMSALKAREKENGFG